MTQMPWDENSVRDDVKQVASGIPVFKENMEKSFVSHDKNANHMLFQGNSFHALMSLLPTHKGKVDAFYIDLVNCLDYTMELEGFFRDNFSNGTESTAWLAFLKPRLDIVKDLLSKNGVIFISVDDARQPWLRLLMNNIFGEDNFVANAVWKNKSIKVNKSNHIATEHEYIVTYAKNSKKLKFNKVPSSLLDSAGGDAKIVQGSLIMNPKLGSYSSGKNEMKKIVGENTDSKPLKFVQGVIRLIESKDAVVVDFLASTGVTAHAVAELNKEDKGKRQSISIDIGSLSYQRIKNSFTGKNWADGKSHYASNGNLRCFDVEIRKFNEGALDADKRHALMDNHVDMVKVESQMFDVIDEFNELNEETFQENSYLILSTGDKKERRYSLVVNQHDYEMQHAQQWAKNVNLEMSNLSLYGSELGKIGWMKDRELQWDDLTFRVVDSHREIAREVLKEINKTPQNAK